MIYFLSASWVCQKLWRPCEKTIEKSTYFLLQFPGILEKKVKSGRSYDYILAFPTAGGHMQEDHLDGVLFDHLMLEGEQAQISNMLIWRLYWLQIWSGKCLMIWSRVDLVHMAINAGVLSWQHVQGIWKRELALNLMNNSSELSLAIKAIRSFESRRSAWCEFEALKRTLAMNYQRIAGKAISCLRKMSWLEKLWLCTMINRTSSIICQSVYQTSQN